MSKGMAMVALAGLLLAATPAAAQTPGRAADWSVIGGETVAPGRDVVYGAFGWPDATFGYTHGMSRDFDLGFKLQLIYGVENTTDTQFGMAFAVPLRWTVARQRNVSVLFHVDPGIRFYTFNPVDFGFQLLPFGLNVESLTNRKVEIDGVTYINNAFGYPQETRIAKKELVCVYDTEWRE